MVSFMPQHISIWVRARGTHWRGAWMLWRREKTFPLPGIKSGFHSHPTHSPVAVLTEKSNLGQWGHVVLVGLNWLRIDLICEYFLNTAMKFQVL
jgi:hypothetical protein